MLLDRAQLVILKAVEEYFGMSIRLKRPQNQRELLARDTFLLLCVELLQMPKNELSRQIVEADALHRPRQWQAAVAATSEYLEPIVRRLDGAVPFLTQRREKWLRQWTRDHQVLLFDPEVAHEET